MKIVITGATGYVGKNIVPLLLEIGHEILLVGRDKAKLGALFPNCEFCEYSEFPIKGQGFDALFHLAVLNNDSKEPIEAFFSVNVDGALETAKLARRAGVKKFVNFSSTHALDPSNETPYALSKKKAAEELGKLEGIAVVNVYLPYVYDRDFANRLTFITMLPRPIRQFAFHVITSLKPAVSTRRIVEFLEVVLSSKDEGAQLETLFISDGQLENPIYAFVRRALDLTFAVSVAVLFWWLLILIWIVVRLESTGPGIFAQERVGQNGRAFICYKFRTMKAGTVNRGTHEVSVNSVTRCGRILRKSKLDELPQIINIFRNEISLIGPRPCLPLQAQLVEARLRLGVLRLKPGISGLAQVNGIDMSEPERLARWDARYMALQSLLLDLKIIIATALGSGNGDRVAK